MKGTRTLAVGLGALALAVAPAVASAAQASTSDAELTVVHAIPKVPVDVYANGAKVLPGFTFTSVAGPLALPPGSYALAVRKAGQPRTRPRSSPRPSSSRPGSTPPSSPT